jgi:serine/threonine protein kinase
MISKDYTTDSNIYLIDFGISSSYLKPDGSHKEINMNAGYRGSIAFSSEKINSLASIILFYLFNMAVGISRKDDLINLLYVLVYLRKGTLPWFPHIVKNEKVMSR